MVSSTSISFIYYKVDFEHRGVGSMLQIGWFPQEVSGGPVVIVVMTRKDI